MQISPITAYNRAYGNKNTNNHKNNSNNINFGQFKDEKAERKVQGLFLAANPNGGTRPLFNMWYEEFKNSEDVTIYVDKSTRQLSYEYSPEVLENENLRYWAFDKKNIPFLEDHYRLQGLYDTLMLIKREKEGHYHPRHKDPDADAETARMTRALEEMRIDALAK